MTEPLIRDISDTARWVAVYRARETERPDAVFRDPFARALAGERGERIAAALPFFEEHAWSILDVNDKCVKRHDTAPQSAAVSAIGLGRRIIA